MDLHVRNITFTTTEIISYIIISFVFRLKNQAIRFYNMKWTIAVLLFLCEKILLHLGLKETASNWKVLAEKPSV